MIDDITRLPTPEWLMALNAYKISTQDIPLRNILHGSLYYPAAGFDGDPVKYLAGNIHSFVFVDYSKSKAAFIEEINSHYRSFKGYELVGKRDVRMEELIPKGWTIQVNPESHENFSEYKNWTEKPYCVWTIFQRNSDYDSRHGPERFSLLYLCADGAAAYQALYNSNNYRPKVLAIIQPGYGFGGNYTDFKRPDGILARSVKANAAGIPDYLINGGNDGPGYYKEPIWPDYPVSRGRAWDNPDRCAHLWKKSNKRNVLCEE